MRFEFATATRVIFGPGTLREVAPLAAQMGNRVYVVTGHTVERATPLLQQLKKQNLEVVTFPVAGEPTTEIILWGAQRAREVDSDLVIGIGGGSVLDVGKTIAALLTNRGDLMDYLEVIGRGQPLTQKAAPLIAIPTTAGTGSEVTSNAVMTVPERRVKVSLRSPLMLPHLAVVDPELTYSLPPVVTASTGLDALTQVIEPYVSNKTNPLTDSICCEGIRRAARSLKRVYQDGSDPAAREDMALVSLFGGLALANAKLGAVHGFAGPIGGMFPIPHGIICARLLPFVIETNVRALLTRAPDHPALARYDEMAQIMTGKSSARANDGVTWVKDLCRALSVPPLADYGLKEEHLQAIVEMSTVASSMKGNPIALTQAELMDIIKKAL